MLWLLLLWKWRLRRWLLLLLLLLVLDFHLLLHWLLLLSLWLIGGLRLLNLIDRSVVASRHQLIRAGRAVGRFNFRPGYGLRRVLKGTRALRASRDGRCVGLVALLAYARPHW